MSLTLCSPDESTLEVLVRWSQDESPSIYISAPVGTEEICKRPLRSTLKSELSQYPETIKASIVTVITTASTIMVSDIIIFALWRRLARSGSI